MAINKAPDDTLSAAFSALADPTRRALLARLASGDADVSELMKPFSLSQPTISKHLKVLERTGLIARGRDASGGPGPSSLRRSRASTSGWSRIATSGSRSSPAWTTT